MYCTQFNGLISAVPLVIRMTNVTYIKVSFCAWMLKVVFLCLALLSLTHRFKYRWHWFTSSGWLSWLFCRKTTASRTQKRSCWAGRFSLMLFKTYLMSIMSQKHISVLLVTSNNQSKEGLFWWCWWCQDFTACSLTTSVHNK